MAFRRFVALLSVGLVWAACAFPDIQFNPADDDNGPGTGAGPGNGGSGGVGAAGGGGAGPGGAGGDPGCTLGSPTACDVGMKCTVVDTTTGETGCGVAGVQNVWTKCNGDGDCASGQWCDVSTEVCHPICQGSAQCGPMAQCIAAKNTENADVPGLKICTSNCHPQNTTPCDDTNGPVTCYYNIADTYWDCIKTIGLTQNTQCVGYDQCNDGLLCPGDSDICEPWCDNPGSFCGAFGFCFGTTPEIIHNGQPWGICGS